MEEKRSFQKATRDFPQGRWCQVDFHSKHGKTYFHEKIVYSSTCSTVWQWQEKRMIQTETGMGVAKIGLESSEGRECLMEEGTRRLVMGTTVQTQGVWTTRPMTPSDIWSTLAPEDQWIANWPVQSLHDMSSWCLGVGLSQLLEAVHSPFVFLWASRICVDSVLLVDRNSPENEVE